MAKTKSQENKQPLSKKIGQLFGNIKKYWNKAPQGKYLSIKEATAYCVGGIGAVGATVIPQYITLAAGLYIAAALEIKVYDIVLIGIINSIIGILRAPLMSLIIDNTHTKYGKFRPYLIWMPLPIMICFMGFGFLDYIPSYMMMLVVYTILFNVVQFFFGLYSMAFTTLLQVITPEQSEKEWLMGIGSFVYSLGPSIIHGGLPLIANLMYPSIVANGINTMGPYRWLIPLMLLVCFVLGYLTAFGTKERIVQPKTARQKIGFVRGIKNTSKNKYFWLNVTSNTMSVFKLIGTSFTAWLCNYAIGTAWAQSVFITILNTAYTPGMLLAPLFIKKFGKKNLTIFSNLACAVLTIPMVLVCIKPMAFTPYLIIVLSYLILLVNSIQVVTMPSMTTQIYDYQQYKTGERLEGFISQFGGIIGTLFGMVTALIQPAIFKYFGFLDNPNVLYDNDIMYPILMASLVLGIVSGALGIIPILFWDMSEKKHMSIIEILKVRALHDDGKLDKDIALELENAIESGDNLALNNYLVEHPLEGSEDFISVVDNGEDITAETEEVMPLSND